MSHIFDPDTIQTVAEYVEELNKKEKLMTRNEVVECFKKHMPEIVNAHRTVDFYIEVGMLKVEEEKTVEQRIDNALIGYCSVPDVMRALEVAGLKIIEK